MIRQSTYAIERLCKINASGRGIQLGLDRMQKLVDELACFDRDQAFVHVAGTNGKGSVSCKIAHGLGQNGLSVGTFNSPHIGTYRERICVNGTMISEDEAGQLLRKLEDAMEKTSCNATYFEILTLLAFMHFREKKVDYAVVEAGLGGRTDSTNVLPNPKVCVITSISLDHEAFLGNTLDKIAGEKAGIIKPGCHVVLGPKATPKHVFDETAAKVGVKSIELVLGQMSSVDDENSAIAAEALRKCGIEKFEISGVRPAGRFERFETDEYTVVLDAAHNPDAMARLNGELQSSFPLGTQFSFVIAMSSNKDVDGCLKALFSTSKLNVDEVIFTRSENESRTADPNDLRDAASRLNIESKVELGNTADAVAKIKSKFIVVCGSFNALAPVRAALVKDMSVDKINMNEK